ncbi:hypothetical protein BC936DRAFT_143459 [Jimgerdemannia flammicorona]|uniref:Major facilitator superfamily (MFS) profile domain-containing protein n=1 Tax=Jimgerdemannia flammicorona TaxID=994334 RepID=A0A432ZZ28_9FUNG|nr:hypothetical protein BC936DRAFT_143459 [Jimgerdemannia flammicorona]
MSAIAWGASSSGTEKIATVIGWLFTSSGCGLLFGAPIAGAILDATRPHLTYIPIMEYGGATLIIAAAALIVMRVNKGLKWERV